MIIHGFVSCDSCGLHLGQLWNQPAAAPDLLPAPDLRICHDCSKTAPLAFNAVKREGQGVTNEFSRL